MLISLHRSITLSAPRVITLGVFASIALKQTGAFSSDCFLAHLKLRSLLVHG
ncbi:MAG: hypothetical protein KME12_25870 [Trichocoleus desertorum ATA4-8-CV12]|nr:hypothetical protein [Trichocoleus desertorum ATA4-8-CV12]